MGILAFLLGAIGIAVVVVGALWVPVDRAKGRNIAAIGFAFIVASALIYAAIWLLVQLD